MNQSTGWADFPTQYRVVEILRHGDTFPKKIVENIHNHFWRDMVQSIIKLNETMKFKRINQIQNMPLLHNSLSNIECKRKWETQGISILSDILNDNGDLMKIIEMNAINLNIHFLDYLKLHNSIKILN